MSPSTRALLIEIAHAHGVQTMVREADGALLVGTDWVGPDEHGNPSARRGTDWDRVRNLRELRQILGY